MRKIKLNVSPAKQVDLLRYYINLGMIFLISVLLIFLGIIRIDSNTEKLKQNKQKLNNTLGRIDYINKEERIINSEIQKIRTQWKIKIDMVNQLIKSKVDGVLTKLDVLEKLIPEGVLIKTLLYGSNNKSIVNITVSAASFKHMIDFYQKLKDSGLTYKIIKETAQEENLADIYVEIKQ